MFTIQEKAVTTALLHMAKHAHEQHVVAGLFLGRTETREVLEAVPLVHTWALTPTVTVAVALATEYGKSKNLEVVGFYAKNAAVLKSLLGSFLRGKGLGAVLDHDTGSLKIVEGQGTQRGDGKMSQLIKEGRFMEIVDFDDHLENPHLTFLE
jgi:hypothetical protein